MDKSKARRYTIAAFALVALILVASVPFINLNGGSASIIIERAVRQIYASHNLIPITVYGGFEEVGATIEPQAWSFKERSEKCFPHLLLPDPRPTSLPSMTTTDIASLRGGISILESLLQTDKSSIAEIAIKHDNARVTAVATGDLRDALDSEACPDLARFFFSAPIGLDRDELSNVPLVISSVYSARRTISITLTNNQSGMANLSHRLADELSKIEFGAPEADLSLAGSGTERTTITLTSSEQVPVAAKPAFYPSLVTDTSMGSASTPTEDADLPPDIIGGRILFTAHQPIDEMPSSSTQSLGTYLQYIYRDRDR